MTAAECIAELEEAARDSQSAGILLASPNGAHRFVMVANPDRLAVLWRLMDAGWEPLAIVRDQLSSQVLPGEVVCAEVEAIPFAGDEWDEQTEAFVRAVMTELQRRAGKAGPLEVD